MRVCVGIVDFWSGFVFVRWLNLCFYGENVCFLFVEWIFCCNFATHFCAEFVTVLSWMLVRVRFLYIGVYIAL